MRPHARAINRKIGSRFRNPYRPGLSQKQLLEPELGNVVRALAAVVGVAVAGADLGQLDLLDAAADGEDQQRLQLQRERLPDLLPVESADAEAVEPHFGGPEQHTLHRNAEVDVDVAVLGDRRADDDESIGFGARQRQMQLGQRATQADAGEDFASLVRQDRTEAQHLLVAGRGNPRVDLDDAAELVFAHDEPGVVAAVAAVFQQEPVERRSGAGALRSAGPIFLHLFA